MTTLARDRASSGSSTGMNIGLWVLQGLLAVAFLGSGLMKLSTPYEQLAEKMAWARGLPAALITFIGLVEVLGALGLVLPSLTRIKPALTPLAASGLALVMVLALGRHLSIGETFIIPNLVLGGLASFVAWGRFKRSPIAPRA